LSGPRWICCHLGAREHYAIPRALHASESLQLLITDAWVRPGSLWRRVPTDLPRRLAERFHPELANAAVRHFTPALMLREALWRSRPEHGWERLIARNQWFGDRAAAVLRRVRNPPSQRTIVFAHSYSAREVFVAAKSRGWTTVLGQIDPGEEHFRVVRRLAETQPQYGAAPAAPPPAYFHSWREECALADRIVVNSDWSRECLEQAGIPAAKLHVIPLGYEPEAAAPAREREYPPAFSAERPLRVLFVGNASVAKGTAALLEAIAQLSDMPIELHLVGAIAMAVPEPFRHHPAIHWVGPVLRSEVMRYYRESDVLVFPSHSDGFGLAQIEAQAWRVPVIASRYCGRVVDPGINGMVLPEVSGRAIALALRQLIVDPGRLAALSRGSGTARIPRLSAVREGFRSLE
jgi:glycosyltransferase involved in cell wall biosynthesis